MSLRNTMEDALRTTILNSSFHRFDAKYSHCFINIIHNQLTPLLTLPERFRERSITIDMANNGSRSGMRLRVNVGGVPVEKMNMRMKMKMRVRGSHAAVAAAEARRRRMPLVKRRRRTTFVKDSGFVPPPLPTYITNQRLVFLFCKKLHKSDVSNLSRIVLPKHSAETNLPRLKDNERIIFPVLDIDGVDAWSFKFRYWPNNHSRMYVFEGTGQFTRKYQLQTGDYMLIYRDTVTLDYIIRAVKASEVEASSNKEETATDGKNADNVVANNADAETFDIPVDTANIPKTESIPGASSINNDNGYFDDILDSFCSWDEFKDFYYTPSQADAAFDDLSGEDLPQV